MGHKQAKIEEIKMIPETLNHQKGTKNNQKEMQSDVKSCKTTARFTVVV